MYKLSLRSNSRPNIFANQSVYWYPIKITSRKQLISVNISSFESFALLKEAWGGRRIAASFPLRDSSIEFIYFGDRGNRLISETFGERASCVRSGALNYFFSKEDAYDLYKRIQHEEDAQLVNSTSPLEVEKILEYFFEKYFENEWSISFTKLDALPTYSSNKVAPHPIMHLFSLIDPSLYSEKYYKELFLYLLQKDFLVKWIDPKNVTEYKAGDILEESIVLSRNKIKNMFDFQAVIQRIILETFNKYNVLNSTYLAVQCGNEKSIIKKLFKNLFSLLPTREKSYIGEVYSNFQPKALIECIEIHFIQSYLSKPVLENIILSLNAMFDRVEYYTLRKRNVLDIDYFNRYRFFCEFKFFNPIDCNELKSKMEDIAYSIDNILIENGIYSRIGEMWVKSIKIQVLTPPQFEDDIQYAVSHIWPISRDANRDFVDKREGIKVMHYILHCDYPLYRKSVNVFSLDYSRDVQFMYAILNNLLFKHHNFSLFAKLKKSDI